ncbi:uncharacterized protein LOC113239292 [Hyposmocoma kahamanoa]|uniref:uncharacterized protein LOC113239292 n=1 Tax=Hyposmocoma kahamanoa TaxID=1477025 RepID=UPI000E6D8A57|nr:uncharacterized protein LOC113239292 [Hyposmocoma kahamanoa]
MPGPIDMLLGVEIYKQIFNGRKFSLSEGFPSAYASIFGWVLMGRAPSKSYGSHQAVSMPCTVDLNSILTKFWEVEEVPTKVIQDPDDLLCEKHFVETHSRDSFDRFIVRLPFKPGYLLLGSTFDSALKRFCGLERKLSKDSRLKELYMEFMRDYLNAGHMRPISPNVTSNRHYIPHHGMLKDSSSTTTRRAVFEPSAPGSSGVSLNQLLMAGPKLQQCTSATCNI